MKRVLFSFIAIFMVSFMSCEKIKDLASFETEFDASFALKAQAAGENTEESAVIFSDVKQEMDDNNLKLSKTKAVLSGLDAEITTPNLTFADFERVEIYLIANGTEQKIAWNTTISSGATNKISCDTEGSNLIDLLESEEIKFKIKYSTRNATEQMNVKITSKFKISKK